MNITLEDNTKYSEMADTSLYDGQPVGIGLLCPSAGFTSCTPSISKNKGGGRRELNKLGISITK